MDFHIRPAELSDIPTLLAHRRGMYRDMGQTGEGEMKQMLAAAERFLCTTLADGSCRAWLAETEGRVAGGGAVHILPWIPGYSDPSPRRAYVHGVYTEPEFRRRGVARKLMETIVAWCRDAGFRSVTLHASDAGWHVYLALGFTPTNEMRLLFPD